MTRTTTTNRGRWPKVTLLVAVTAGLLLWWAVPASAHVEAAGAAGINGATTVTFSFTHGCTGSPTTGLRIQLPDGTTNVQATPRDGFNSNTSSTELSWTGGNIPDSQSAQFTASMVLQGTVGETVFFPTIQTCVTGEESWIEKTDDPEADNAAPRIQLVVAGPTTTTTSTTEPTTTTTAPSTTTTTAPSTTTTTAATTSTTRAGTTIPVQTTSDSGTPWLWIILIIVAAVGAAIVGLLLYQRSQANKPPADGENPPTDPGVPPTAPPGGAPSGTTAPATTPPAAAPPATGPAAPPPTTVQPPTTVEPPAGEPPTVAQPPTEPWGTGGTGGTPPAV